MTEVSFSLDYVVILRLSGAFLWGLLLALFLQWTRIGRFLADERTWASVVIGVGVDLLIAYPAGWWTIAGVVVASGLPMIARSMLLEARVDEEGLGRNKLKWLLEDAIAYSNNLADLLEQALDPERKEAMTCVLSKALRIAHTLGVILRDGRAGRYEQRRSL